MKRQDFISKVAAVLSLIPAAPAIAVCALALVIEDGGPIFFRQRRIGKDGKPFDLIKLRSMRRDSHGASITAQGDSRITRIGEVLRKYKIDELPQLWNILRGEMRFIGPRPEVPQYVDLSDSRWQTVLSVEPGITDLAALAFRNEETLLHQQSDLERFYRDSLLPRKLDMSAYYIRTRSFATDAKLIALTIKHSLLPRHFDRHTVEKQFAYEGFL
jgi:lipopolysaccharide/colanic/teichoic acid biosynthesis glycosyltransferase